MSVTVRDHPDESRYEVYDGDELAGFAAYKLGTHQIAFTHTETDEAYAGRGLAKQLVSEALDDARHRGLAVLPFCSFVGKVIAEDTAAYLDLVPEKDRERFGLPGTAD
jgi:predicted GNAT family acetyltransferase